MPDNVHLTDPSSEVHDYLTIQSALNDAALNSWSNVSIVCDTGYTGETGNVSNPEGVNASLQILGNDVSFGDKSLSLNGKIELGPAAFVKSVGNVTSSKNGIVLADGTSTETEHGTIINFTELNVSNIIAAEGVAGDIDVGANATMVAGGTISAAGDIDVKSYATMISGSTINATGDIEVESDAKVYIGTSTEPGDYAGIKIAANTEGMDAHGIIVHGANGITLEAATSSGSSAKMISGGTIYSAKDIDVQSYASIKGSSITAGGDIDVAAYAEMIAGGTISAVGAIDVANGAKVLIGDSDPAEGFTGIMLGTAAAAMTAGSGVTAASVSNAGTINLGLEADTEHEIPGTAAPMTVTNTVTNTGTINIRNAGLLDSGEVGITAAGIDNTGGTITVDATGYDGSAMKLVVETTASAITGNAIQVEQEGYYIFDRVGASGYEYWLTNAAKTPVYANSTWNISEEFGIAATKKSDPTEVVSGKYSLYNAAETVNAAVETALLVGADEIIVQGGAHDDGEGVYLSGIKTTIESDAGEFARGVLCGVETKVAGDSSRTIDVSVAGGKYAKVFVGGNNIVSPTGSGNTVNIESTGTVSISGGSFGGVVSGGDRFQQGQFNLFGDVNTVITGGSFSYAVAGGLLNATGAMEKGQGIVKDDVNLTIKGGTFDNASHSVWIYGGCISTKRGDEDDPISSQTTIEGNVTITVDTSALTGSDKITLCSIAVGSHGWGAIYGDAELVFTGEGSKIEFASKSQIWGSCGGDDINTDYGKIVDSLVDGARILSFTGFSGTLACEKIRGFSDIKVTGGSDVTLNSKCNLSDTEKWTFENDSTLSGDFVNNFAGVGGEPGDVLNLILGKSESFTDGWEILADTDATDSKDVFKGFGSFSAVNLEGFGAATGYDSGNLAWYWGADYENATATVGLETSGSRKSMVLHLA